MNAALTKALGTCQCTNHEIFALVSSLISDSNDLYNDANVETQHFIQAAIAYEKSQRAADPGYKTEFNWNHDHKWEEVLEIVEKTAQDCNDSSGVWGRVRKAFRSLGNNHKVFAAWMNILPTQSQYASIICGALKLVLGVCIDLKLLSFPLTTTRLHHD